MFLPKLSWCRNISIHSLHTEGDLFTYEHLQVAENFNPLPPHGGRLRDTIISIAPTPFQSTPSTRRETSTTCLSSYVLIFQSTPSTRRETWQHLATRENHDISIHSLHTEGDLTSCCFLRPYLPFQSTPSTRRETNYIAFRKSCQANFNPLPPHGGRQP